MPTPASTPTPTPVAVDSSAPVVRAASVRVRSGRPLVRLTLSEAATVRIAVQRRAPTGWVTLRTRRARLSAGSVQVTLTKAAARGQRLWIIATDLAGNRSTDVMVALPRR